MRDRSRPERAADDGSALEKRLPRGTREPAVGDEGVDQCLTVGRTERLELDRRRANAAAAPTGPDVEELGPGQAEQQHRDVADPGPEMLDQLEQRVFGPMDVLEDENERLRISELLGPGSRCPRDLVLIVLGLDGLENAGREPEEIGDRLV